MRWSDLIGSSLASLKQRFFRTALTVLGVLIGTTSVVVMVSLGIGMSQSMMDQMQNNATMTRVTVSPGSASSGGGMMGGGVSTGKAKSSKDKVLDAATINELKKYDGITKITPVYTVLANAQIGRYSGYLTVTAMPAEALAAEGLDLGQGRLPTTGDPLSLVVGYRALNVSSGGPADGSSPKIDWMGSQLFLSFENPTATANNGGQVTTATTASPRKFIVPVTGVIAGDENTWNMNDWSTFADLDKTIAALRKAYPGKALPNQPATADGKPRSTSFQYSNLYLTADSVERAESLTNELREAGYSVSSNIELMRSMQQISLTVQAVFGGIGFISLLVAAIGIANTMMMSVYERTKQIGIMKVLGASLPDIRNMFLVESACIGFFGGVVGLLLSYLLSAGLNATLGQAGGLGGGTEISIIPPWLALASIVFSTLIGTLAGVMPANRAMKLSPLAAIRSE